MSLAANIYTVSRRLDRLLLILTDGEVCVLRLHNPSSNVGRENHILHLVRKIVPVPAVLASGGDWSIHSFVHGDFNPTNILVHKGAVTCILDWEFSHAGSPYMDIGNLLRHMDPMHHGEIEAGLVAGGLNVPPDWRRKAELIDLNSHLEFLTTQRSDAFKQRCADWIRDFAERY
jgi:thiamine kinase-like enzyme